MRTFRMKLVSTHSLTMHTPFSVPALSIGIIFRWHALFSIFACAYLNQCAYSSKGTTLVKNNHQFIASSRATPKIEWYVASRDPLIMCPKGYRFPKNGGTYVFLTDRRTRYYIPSDCPPEVLEEAFAMRRASRSIATKTKDALESFIEALFDLIGGM